MPTGVYLRPPPTVRFWRKVNKDGPIHPVHGQCWVWVGGNKGRKKYGQFGRSLAHRFSWMIHFGTIPSGLIVCHHCDNPSCVNPSHLFLGTEKTNAEDCCRKGRQTRGQKVGVNVLSPDDVMTVLRRYKRGCRTNGAVALAKEFNVSHSQIRRIVRNENWKHLQGDKS